MLPKVTVVVAEVVAVVICIFAVQGIKGNEDLKCALNEGVPHFQLKMLCGKKVYALFMSGNEGDCSCVISHFHCFDNGTTTCDSIVLERGKRVSKTSWLTDLGKGVVFRESISENGELNEMLDFVTSFTEFSDDNVKVSYYICGKQSEDDNRIMRAIMTTFEDADLTDDVYLMNSIFPWKGLYLIPNHCDVNI